VLRGKPFLRFGALSISEQIKDIFRECALLSHSEPLDGRDKVKRGQRPIRPSDELSKVRGLTDEVWDLVEICWSSDATQRLTAAVVVERLRALPNQPMDLRPVDDFGADFPSRSLYKHSEQPFSALDLPPFSPMDNGDVGGNGQCEYRKFVHWPFRF
jgi:hypothetical protein